MATREKRRTPAARTPRQDRGKETVRAILDATERLLAEGGARTLKMTRVASVAGVSVGSLYEYFPTKKDLLRAVEEAAWAAQAGKITAVMVEIEGQPLDVAIVRIVEFAMRVLAERGAIHGITVDDPETKAGRLVIMEGVVAFASMRLSKSAHRVRPKDLRLALNVAVKTVAAMTWLGHRDHEDSMASGRLPREVGIMVARYLIRDATVE